MVRATVSGPPDKVRFTIETWPCRVAAMASSRWGSFALLEELRTQVAVLDDRARLQERGKSPISSRNRVPPSAALITPLKDSTAPVKAPRLWPNGDHGWRAEHAELVIGCIRRLRSRRIR